MVAWDGGGPSGWVSRAGPVAYGLNQLRYASRENAAGGPTARGKDFRFGIRGAEAPDPHEAGGQARLDEGRRAGRRRVAPRDSPSGRASVRHGRPFAQSQRARSAGRGGAGRNVRIGSAGAFAEGRDDQRYSDQWS